MQNIYTIKSRLAELREELMNHAAAWSDVPGGADNPIAQAEYARIWKELETLSQEAQEEMKMRTQTKPGRNRK